MPAWFWLSIPLAAVIFAAVTGIPLWLVIRHPDAGEDGTEGAARRRAPAPLHAASMGEAIRRRDAA